MKACALAQQLKLDEDQRDRVLIHELMHIPKTFGGGFKFHDFVTERNVNKYYQEYSYEIISGISLDKYKNIN